MAELNLVTHPGYTLGEVLAQEVLVVPELAERIDFKALTMSVGGQPLAVNDRNTAALDLKDQSSL